MSVAGQPQDDPDPEQQAEHGERRAELAQGGVREVEVDYMAAAGNGDSQEAQLAQGMWYHRAAIDADPPAGQVEVVKGQLERIGRLDQQGGAERPGADHLDLGRKRGRRRRRRDRFRAACRHLGHAKLHRSRLVVTEELEDGAAALIHVAAVDSALVVVALRPGGDVAGPLPRQGGEGQKGDDEGHIGGHKGGRAHLQPGKARRGMPGAGQRRRRGGQVRLAGKRAGQASRPGGRELVQPLEGQVSQRADQ